MLKTEISNRSKKFLKNCDNILYDRIINKIKELEKDPFPQDVKRIIGRKEKVFRIRIGKCRIEYVLFLEKNLLFISDIDKRPRIYDK